MRSPDLLSLVGDLHEGVVDDDRWRHGLDRLSDYLDQRPILLGAVLKGGSPEFVGHRMSDAMIKLLSGLATPQANPWIGAAWAARLRRPVTDEDIVDAERLRTTELWTKAYLPSGTEYSVGAVLDRQPDRAEICLIPGTNGADFSAVQRRNFGLLVPHIARAWRVRRAVQSWRARASEMEAVLDHLERGVILTAPDGEVRFANRAAERLLSEGDGIDVTQGRLRAARPRESAALAGIISRAAQTGIGQDGCAVDAVALPRAHGRVPLAVVAEPLAPAHGDRLGQNNCPGAILFVGDAAAHVRPSPERLGAVYGLTHAEAQVAARFASGGRLATTARALGVSENTTKTHVKAIYEKVGVTRQTEFVRRVIADVGGLAQEGAHGPNGTAEAASAIGTV